jgi:hypothetical protein
LTGSSKLRQWVLTVVGKKVTTDWKQACQSKSERQPEDTQLAISFVSSHLKNNIICHLTFNPQTAFSVSYWQETFPKCETVFR